MKFRHALGATIDSIEHQAVQMDVEIGGRSKTLDEGDRAGRGFGTFESGLLYQKCRYDAADDLQDGREQVGM
jgi:hypothetical protein